MLLTSRKHNPASFKIIVNNHNISPEDNLKYLGVLLDNKFKLETSCTKSLLAESYETINHWPLHHQFNAGKLRGHKFSEKPNC